MTFPSVPSPSTWSAGEVVTAPQLRSDVSNAVAFLSSPPMFIGQQTTLAQSIPAASVTQIQMDTELYDNWNGHGTGNNPQLYYGMVAGWYLCEMTVPLNPGTSGQMAGLIGGVQNGGSLTSYGGSLIPYASTQTWQATAAKLMLMEQVGTFGGASNDYISASVFQNNSGSSTEPLSNTAGAVPWLSVRWVCSVSGSQPLPVPSNPAFPSPPTALGHVFMNANIRDTVNFLTYPPVMEAYRAGGGGSLASTSSIPAVGTTVPLTSVTTDNYSAFNTSSFTWTAPVAGLYYCYGCVSGQTSADGSNLGAGITVTSANYNGGSQVTLWGGTMAVLVSSPNATCVRRRLRLNAGDTVSLGAVQYDTGGNQTTYVGTPWEPRLIIVWESS
jgi:hypothetical protein